MPKVANLPPLIIDKQANKKPNAIEPESPNNSLGFGNGNSKTNPTAEISPAIKLNEVNKDWSTTCTWVFILKKNKVKKATLLTPEVKPLTPSKKFIKFVRRTIQNTLIKILQWPNIKLPSINGFETSKTEIPFETTKNAHKVWIIKRKTGDKLNLSSKKQLKDNITIDKSKETSLYDNGLNKKARIENNNIKAKPKL